MRTDDLQEIKATTRLTAPHKRMQTLIRQAHRAGYNVQWAALRFLEEFQYDAPSEFWLHALYPQADEASLIRYTAYLAKLAQAKDKSFPWALNFLIKEFSPGPIQARLGRVREVWTATQQSDLVLESLKAAV